jgi:hypothetical protein
MFFIEYKKNYKLTLEQKEALIGVLLGDGYLSRFSFKGNTALCLEQSYTEKKNYLMHLFELYKPLITNYPKIIIRKPDKRTGKYIKVLLFVRLNLVVLMNIIIYFIRIRLR